MVILVVHGPILRNSVVSWQEKSAYSKTVMKRPPFPKVMATGDVCSYLRLSREYISLLARQGKLRCQHTSGGRIFLKADIVAFKKRREEKAKSDRRFHL